jgi:Uncharacterized protein conserved in bacteria
MPEPSKRHVDANGFMHVADCNITKECINEYYGTEIPGWRNLGLDPHKLYKGYRSGAELEKAASTFNGLPLLSFHVVDSARTPQKSLRVGNLGTDCRWETPYLKACLILQDGDAIQRLDEKRELSASYRFDPVFEPGSFNGEAYDFVMTNIRGNHVALVEDGRAGPDVLVADANPKKRNFIMNLAELLKSLGVSVGDPSAAPSTGDQEAGNQPPSTDNAPDPAMDFEGKLRSYIEGMEDKELAAKLMEAIQSVTASSAAQDENAAGAPPAQDNDVPAKDEDAGKKEDNPAMDRKPKTVRPNVTNNITLAMDENAIAQRIQNDLKAKIEAANLVKPLIGTVDGLAFDSAPSILKKALELSGHNVATNDHAALTEMVKMAISTNSRKNDYPDMSPVMAMDSKAEQHKSFAHLSNIKKEY